MNEEDVLRLLGGSLETATVGRLQHNIASYFNAHTIVVKIGRRELLHIRERHPDIFPDDILHLETAVHRGLLLQEDHRPNHLSCCYQHPINEGHRFIAGLKFAAGYHELWVSTFHRAKTRQTKRIIERSRAIIRTHL